MLEIIYGILSWAALVLAISTGFSNFRLMKGTASDKMPVKVIDSMVNKCIVLGIIYGACLVTAFFLQKNVSTLLINWLCSFIWLLEARKYLKVSNFLKEKEKED